MSLMEILSKASKRVKQEVANFVYKHSSEYEDMRTRNTSLNNELQAAYAQSDAREAVMGQLEADAENARRDYQTTLAQLDAAEQAYDELESKQAITQRQLNEAQKREEALKGLVGHLKYQIRGTERGYQGALKERLRAQRPRRKNMLLLDEDGEVLGQTAASRRKIGDYIGQTFASILDLNNPKQYIQIGDDVYTAIREEIMPSLTSDGRYVFLTLKPAPVEEALRWASQRGKDISNFIKRTGEVSNAQANRTDTA
ncbi:MAG: hypothetical protein ACP5D2_00190 [Candidatus Nanoarchaeia archaeon]